METKGWLLGDADEYYTSIRKIKLLAMRPKTHIVVSHDPKLCEKYQKAPKSIN